MPVVARAISPAMREALTWLDERQVRYRQMTPHQVKIGQVSYFPGKGTIFVDQETARRPDTGLVALAGVLVEFRYL